MAFEDLRYPPACPFHETKALQRAILGRSPKKVRFLLEQGSDVNVPCGRKRIRPLMLVCYVQEVSKREKILDLLFQARAAPGMVDCYGRNSLFYACALERKDVVSSILLGADFDLAARDHDGNTALHVCAMVGVSDILRNVLVALTKYGVDISQRNALNVTPLAAAILCSNLQCAVILHKFGACPRYSEEDFKVIASAIHSEEAAQAFAESDSVVRDSILVASQANHFPLPSLTDLLPFRPTLNEFHCLPLLVRERIRPIHHVHTSLLTKLDRSSVFKDTSGSRKVHSRSADATSSSLNRVQRLPSSHWYWSGIQRQSPQLSVTWKDLQHFPSSVAVSEGSSTPTDWQPCNRVIKILQEKVVPAQHSYLFPVIKHTQVAVNTEWVDTILALKPPILTTPDPSKERLALTSAKKKIFAIGVFKKLRSNQGNVLSRNNTSNRLDAVSPSAEKPKAVDSSDPG